MRDDLNYKQTVEYLRNIRLENRERFFRASSKMTTLLDNLKGNPFSRKGDMPLITYDDLKSFEKGLWFDIDNEAFLRLEEEDEDKMKFSVVLKAGAKFALKRHDSMQSVLINEGRLIDLHNNTTYVQGDEIIYLEYEPHEHASDIYSKYTIYFHTPSGDKP